MAIILRRTRLQTLRWRASEIRGRVLDWVYSPVISRLTVEEYFACRTRNDCLRAYLGRRLG